MTYPSWIASEKAAAIPTIRAAAVAAVSTAGPGTRDQMRGIEAALAWLNGEVGAPTGEPRGTVAVTSDRASAEWFAANRARVAGVGFLDGVGDALGWLVAGRLAPL